MTLTKHLRNSKSPVRRFFDSQFPNARPFARDLSRELRDAETIRPGIEPKPHIYGILGQAIDYRLRYYFEVTHYKNLVAWRGAELVKPVQLGDGDGGSAGQVIGAEGQALSSPLVDRFFDSLTAVLEATPAVGRRLDEPSERLLNRYCYALGCFETIYRSGWGAVSGSPLFLNPLDEVEDFLALAKPEWIEDLNRQSWLFFDSHPELLHRWAVLNPGFDGSADVGGADADMILGGFLIDFKATVKSRLDKKMLHQLLGYVLLDYEDRHQLEGVGIYMSRQGRFFEWTMAEFLELLGQKRAPPELRAEFREVVAR
jgi:hypothetical protein